MADSAIALIAVGSGETTQEEIDDLLNDAYGDNDIGLMVPVDKALYSKTVANVVSWYNEDDGVIPVLSEGASMTRGSSALGGEEGPLDVDKFTDALDPQDFEEFSEVHVLIAPPEDQDSPEMDFLADVVEIAQKNGWQVKDLTKALDDVDLEEEEAAPEPEPEPEPEEKPKRRSRAKKAEDVPPTPEDEPTLQEQIAESKAKVDAAKVPTDLPPTQVFVSREKTRAIHGALLDIAKAYERLAALYEEEMPIDSAPEPEKAQEEPEEPKEDKPKRRGRPRTNFEVKQVWDEDDEEWIKRPPGRIAKGTKYRTFNTETEEVIEEGIV